MQKDTILSTTGIFAFVLLILAPSHQIGCHQLPSNEPYSYQFDPYSYGYDVEDNYGNKQWKQESSNNPQEVHGSYGYRDKNGIYREVVYVADKNGFRANIKTNEPGVAGTKDPAGVKIESYYSPPPSANVPVHTKYVSTPSFYPNTQAEIKMK